MKRLLFTFLLPYACLTHFAHASTQLELFDASYFSDNRLGQVLKARTQEVQNDQKPMPTFENPYEVIDFARAFTQGEQQFWQDLQQGFRAQHKRLNAILTIVENAVKRLPPGASNLDKINTKHGTLFNIFSSSSVTTEDNYTYEVYNSYEEAIKCFGELDMTLAKLEQEKNLQATLTISAVSSFLLNKEKNLAFKKRIHTTSCVKSINKMLKDSPQYYACDLDKIIPSFKVLLLKILKSYNEKLIPVEEKKTSIQRLERQTSSKKKKKKKGTAKANTKLNTVIAIPSSSEKQDVRVFEEVQEKPSFNEEMAHSIQQVSISESEEKASALDEQITSSFGKIKVEKEPNNPQTIISGSDEKDDFNAKEQAFPHKETSLSTLETSKENKEEDSTDIYMERPWELYQLKKDTKASAKQETLSAPQPKKIEISLAIEETLLTFFSTEQTYAVKNVSMSEFLSLISSHFNGYVYRVGENLHFMAQHPQTRKWYSAPMHVLHGDKKQIIPRNTRYYWSRAKKLLENVEAQKLLTDTNLLSLKSR